MVQSLPKYCARNNHKHSFERHGSMATQLWVARLHGNTALSGKASWQHSYKWQGSMATQLSVARVHGQQISCWQCGHFEHFNLPCASRPTLGLLLVWAVNFSHEYALLKERMQSHQLPEILVVLCSFFIFHLYTFTKLLGTRELMTIMKQSVCLHSLFPPLFLVNHGWS